MSSARRMKAFDLEREQFLAGFMPDEQLRHVAVEYARQATQEYESARWAFARRHQPDYGPTRWADLVRQRLRMCRHRRAIAAFYFVELLKREAAALTNGQLIREWWEEYRRVLADKAGFDKLRALTRELEARGIVKEGRPMPTTVCKDLADECDRLKRARNRL